MIFQLFFSVVSPLAIGFLLVCILWPGARPLRSDSIFKLCLSVGPGFGLFSCLYFLQLSLFGPSRKRLAAELLALSLVLLAVLSYRILRLKGEHENKPQQEPPPNNRLRKAIPIVFFTALASAIVAFIFYSLKKPHGEWDAWAVFNMKARFLFRAGDQWRDLFSEPLQWSGPDYPLLIPAATAACWTLMVRETLIVPALLASLFTFATVGVLGFSVSMLRGRTQGYLAALILLCTPFFITHGANQYTDIPVGFFYLAALALLTLHDQLWEKSDRLILLAGLMAGLAAWTKNEGLLFIALVIATRFAVTFRQQGVKSYLRQMAFFMAGLMPILIVVFYFKATLAAQNGYLSPLEESNVFSRIVDFSRYRMITDYLVKIGLGFGNWSVSVVPLLAFYLLLLGMKIEEKQKKNVIASVIILSLMLVGFLIIYVISSRDLNWLIATSLDRLLAQLWPSFIFTFFLIVKTPEEALMREDVMSAPA